MKRRREGVFMWGVREGLPLDRQADRQREKERGTGRVTRLYNVNFFSIFHIETVEQTFCMLLKSNIMSVQTKWIYRYYHMYT